MSPGSRRGLPRLVLLSGWLFADLLLVLFLTVLGGVPAAPGAAGPGPSASASVSPSASPSSSPSVIACPQSFDLRPVRLTIGNITLAGVIGRDPVMVQRVVDQARQQVAGAGRENTYAGLILAFGLGPNEVRGQARMAANVAGTILKEQLPRFGNVLVREFNYETAETGTLHLDVYFLVRC